ncbi:MAG: DUF2530 domain-containing protein [Candidatus Nanopelagicales bacterium]
MKELSPLKLDGIREIKVGTLLFFLFFLVFLFRFWVLNDAAALFWLQVCLTGAILGFMGYLILNRRREKSL